MQGKSSLPFTSLPPKAEALDTCSPQHLCHRLVSPCTSYYSVLPGKDARQQLLGGVPQHASKFGLAGNHADEVLGLLERDVRWKRRHIRIGVRFQYNRPIRRQRFVPSSPDFVRIIDKDALQSNQLGISMIRKIGNALGGFGLARTQFDSLLPGDLIEIAVVEDENDQSWVGPFLPVFGDRDHHIQAV